MIGLDSYQGFWLLLILPLLLWFQHSRWKLRDVVLSVFPVIEDTRPETRPPSSRSPRMSRRLRLILVAVALLSLTLAFNGLHLAGSEDKPGEWLVILDNPFTGHALIDGNSVHRTGTEAVRRFTRGLNPRDSHTLLLTSPNPGLHPGLSRRDLLTLLDDSAPSMPFPAVEDAAGIAARLVRAVPFKGILVVSPRGQRWRELMSEAIPPGTLLLPEGFDRIYGNAGIVAFDVTPAGSGFFDVYFRVASRRLDIGEISVRLRQREGTVLRTTVTPGGDGASRTVLEGVRLLPGALTLQLEVDDLLRLDNEVRAVISADADRIYVDMAESTRPFIRTALLAEKRVRRAGPASGAVSGSPVRVIDGRLPDRLQPGPALVIFPTRDFGGFTFDRIWTTPLSASFNPVHPVTRNVGFREFRPSKIAEFDVPEGFQVLAEADGVPLIMAGQGEAGRMVIWSFDPGDNGLYLDPSFPILALESVRWLAGSEQAAWDEGYPCEGGGGPQASQGPSLEEPGNILCTGLTLEATEITVPRLPEVDVGEMVKKTPVRTDLARLCLKFALLILFVLALDSALGRRKGS